MIQVKDVFKTVGVPTYTYVERDNGYFERNLTAGILNEGNICLLTGPSKTGKTSLYNKILKDLKLEPLIVRCDREVTPVEFWKKALEKVSFERVTTKEEARSTSIQGGGKIGIELGWRWLSKIVGEINLGIEKEKSESEIREIILSMPSPEHLIPILKELNYLLIAEDFHYLLPEVQEIIFQQWKSFVDNEVSALVVGTTHHAVDIAFANKDLQGRIIHIEMNMWSNKDLMQIVTKGFQALNIDISLNMVSVIANESAGLPIITQSACFQFFTDKNVHSVNNESKRIDIIPDQRSIYVALHNVAVIQYNTYSIIFEILSAGIRANKYDTYKIVLLTFTIDPPIFSLKKAEIDERIKKIIKKEEERPPQSSINNTLKSLSALQKRNNLELLEWSETQNKLFILEPAFLFYIRWREERASPITTDKLLEDFIKLLDIKNKTIKLIK